MTGCHATGNVSGGGNYVGGVAGLNHGSVTGCHATGDVSGPYYVGGVAGYNYGTVTGCYATGNDSGDDSAGGGGGGNYSARATRSYAAGDVTGTDFVGGVVGWNYGTLTGCYWSVYDGNGIGYGSNGEATKVDGTTITWVDAQSGMNDTIETWNGDNLDAPCNWRYAGATETTPPTLAENK